MFDDYTMTDVGYGQATSDGMYDDVETYDQTGAPTHVGATGNVSLLAWAYVALALAGLWVMGAAIFKGSNQS